MVRVKGKKQKWFRHQAREQLNAQQCNFSLGKVFYVKHKIQKKKTNKILFPFALLIYLTLKDDLITNQKKFMWLISQNNREW